jgi:hypothetical protein
MVHGGFMMRRTLVDLVFRVTPIFLDMGGESTRMKEIHLYNKGAAWYGTWT